MLNSTQQSLLFTALLITIIILIYDFYVRPDSLSISRRKVFESELGSGKNYSAVNNNNSVNSIHSFTISRKRSKGLLSLIRNRQHLLHYLILNLHLYRLIDSNWMEVLDLTSFWHRTTLERNLGIFLNTNTQTRYYLIIVMISDSWWHLVVHRSLLDMVYNSHFHTNWN